MARQIARKVIDHSDFGRCVLLPKTHWSAAPSVGPVDVLVDGVACTVTVCVERCDCRGTGEHEHRFLTLPDQVPAGESVRIDLPGH